MFGDIKILLNFSLISSNLFQAKTSIIDHHYTNYIHIKLIMRYDQNLPISWLSYWEIAIIPHLNFTYH